MGHWLQHIFGFWNGAGNSPQYLFWSGAGSDLAYLSFLWAGLLLYRKHNCRVKWCPRIARHQLKDPVTGLEHMVCWRHHPGGTRSIGLAKLRDLQEKHHLYLGGKPGRG